jgi:CO/xanthine dehydrogenase FAD-binding subunit
VSIAELAQYEFASPRALAEACGMLEEFARSGTPAFPVAGCTDWMVERHASPMAGPGPRGMAVDVTRIPELRGIEERDGVLFIGAAETFLALRRHPLIARRCPVLGQAAAMVEALQIQTRGTLGGNLVTGSPAADGVVALFALDAQVVLASAAGRRRVPITAFYTGYRASVRAAGELVVGFELKAPADGSVQRWRKVGTRSAQAISKAAVAMLAETDSEGVIRRIGLGAGSVAATVRGLDEARAMLLGSKAGQVELEALGRAVDAGIAPMDDLRSTARYRRHVVRTLVCRFVEELAVKK